MKQSIEIIATAIRPAIEGEGAYLEEVTVTPAGRRSLVTVIVDSEKHLSLDEVTSLSRIVSEIVENLTELGDTPFTLEVSSPGIDRPLTLPRHFRKNIGRLVQITKSDGTTTKGRISTADENSVVVDESTIAFTEISKAILEIEFKSLSEKEAE